MTPSNPAGPPGTDELRRAVAAIDWWHTMELAPGVVTPGRQGAGTQQTLRRLRLPDRLDGKSVLDIGAWDGFFSFEAERRGASRVLATDHFAWHSNSSWADKRGFELAKSALGSSVASKDVDALDISPETVGLWDVVILSGVLYHVVDPLGCILRAASVTRDLLIVETHLSYRPFERSPSMVFMRPQLLDADPTNLWAPNRPCVEQMLRYAGFSSIDTHADPQESLSDRLWQVRSRQRRMVFHAHAART